MDQRPLRRPGARTARRDEAWFFLDYTPGAGLKSAPGNALIWDLKTPIAAAKTHPWRARRKRSAIGRRAVMISHALATLWKPGAALVPTPPSKPIGDPDYDDRMLQIARRSHAPDGTPTPVLDVVKQARRLRASHVTARRPQIDTLVKAYALEDTPLAPERLIVLDDILTTGRHFRAMNEVLRRRFPAAEIVGLFIARRVWNEPGLSEAATGVADWGPPPKV